MPKVDIIVIALSSPILIGVYKDNVLSEQFETFEKSSDYLPHIFGKLLENYVINSVTYANGPGSFMAIKLTYLFLQTLHITKGIEILAALGFDFNNNTPIKALGKLYFHHDDDGKITMKPLEETSKLEEMRLPKVYEKETYLKDSAPNYILPAVN